ncbi:unnamed protein product [Meloidogyne enterolobii]|uniref:Uncharacterized protein n=1 Tax=Meloidogyne enterolobii TaxID=390850 RepID=A0ACB0ZFJ7_MELEN
MKSKITTTGTSFLKFSDTQGRETILIRVSPRVFWVGCVGDRGCREELQNSGRGFAKKIIGIVAWRMGSYNNSNGNQNPSILKNNYNDDNS